MVSVEPCAMSSRPPLPPQPPAAAARASATSARDVPRAGYFPGAMHIGVLTGGGDCPGLNALIRAIARKGIAGYDHTIVGYRDGWRAPLENACEELTIE